MEKGKAILIEESFVGLESLRVGSQEKIKVMVCRKWDVTNAYGKYRSTEYILSDDQGDAILCSARSNISHCFATKLIEGKIYSFKNFSVARNKDKYRIRNSDAHIIELDGYSIVRPLDCPIDGFTRFPFQLIPLNDIRANDSTYLIDVVGCPTDVGVVRTTKTGSEVLDFYLIDSEGTRVRVTLWGSLCIQFLTRLGQEKTTYIVLLPSMSVTDYFGEIYLSSTSGTTLFDSQDMPQIAALRESLGAENTPAVCMVPPPASPRRVTLADLIRLGKEQKESRRQTMALECKVRIQSIRTKDSWFYHACGLNGCKKRVGRVGTGFWCDTCKKSCEFPRPSYRVHLNVVDDTANVVATVFDDVAEVLLKKKAVAFFEEESDNPDIDVLPHELQNLVGASHVFEMKTHSYFDNKTYVSFSVSKVVELNLKAESTPNVGAKRPREDSFSPDEHSQSTDKSPGKSYIVSSVADLEVASPSVDDSAEEKTDSTVP